MSAASTDPSRALDWMRAGTRWFVELLEAVDDPDFAAPTLLAEWDRAHLLAHLARNADALGNLLSWASTGVETPMYPSPSARADDIETSAARPASVIRADVLDGIARLDQTIAQLPGPAWTSMVRTAQGRAVPAAEVPWMRTREVWVHAVDLDAGGGFDAVPVDVAVALLADAGRFAATRDSCPSVRVEATDADFRLTLLTGDELVSAPVRDLLPWLLGRRRLQPAEAAGWPVPPRWL